MLKDSSPGLRGARGPYRAAKTLSPIIVSVLLAACGLSTEGELYEEPTGGDTTPSTSVGPGSGGGSSSSQGAGGNGTGGVGGKGGNGGTGGVGGDPQPENCFDGLDNDQDELVDCADAKDCNPVVECVPAIPAGWTEYVRYVVLPHTGEPISPPACAAPSGYFMGPAGAPTCDACSCKWTGASCSAPEIECFSGNTSCTGSVDAKHKAENENCITLVPFSAGGTDESCRISAPATVVNAGTCNASGGGGEKNELPWKDEVFTCPVPVVNGAGCPSNQECAPKPGNDYPGALCIQSDGDKMCPAEFNASRVVVYKSGSDNRACSACACNNDLGCNNDGYYTAYDFNNCTGGQPVQVNGGCTGNVTENLGADGSLKPKLATVKEGTCSGGVASGSVDPMDPVTICCK